jgi:hypothetical protein
LIKLSKPGSVSARGDKLIPTNKITLVGDESGLNQTSFVSKFDMTGDSDRILLPYEGCEFKQFRTQDGRKANPMEKSQKS